MKPTKFEDLVALPDSKLPLTLGALLIAKEEYPDLDVNFYIDKLKTIAGEIKPKATLNSLNEYFFYELGFRGNNDDYSDPKNSFLNDVIERRKGIPITLSIVYIEIAREAGFAVHGIGFPGHYLVRCENGIIDCFNQRTVDVSECQELLDTMYSGKVKFTDSMLRPCTTRETIVRILNNLKAIYIKREVYRKALRFAHKALLLEPNSPELLRDRAVLYLQLEDFGNAIKDLERYIQEFPKAPDAKPLEEQLVRIRRIMHNLN